MSDWSTEKFLLANTADCAVLPDLSSFCIYNDTSLPITAQLTPDLVEDAVEVPALSTLQIEISAEYVTYVNESVAPVYAKII